MALDSKQLRVAIAFLATSVTLVACTPDDPPATSPSDSGKAQAEAAGPYEDIGEAGTGSNNRCYVNDQQNQRQCEGFPKESLLQENPDSKAILKWIARRGWQPSSPWTLRKPATGTTPQRMRVEAIQYPEKMRLKELVRRGMVVAKIVADPTGPADRRYGIGGFPAGVYEDIFFLVLDKYYDSDTAELNESRKIAGWRIFGIRKAVGSTPAKWERVGKTGAFRFCREKHPSPPYDGDFYACGPSHKLAAIQQLESVQAYFGNYPIASALTRDDEEVASGLTPRETLEARLNGLLSDKVLLSKDQRATILDAAQNRFDAPLWMLCGAGCCTADEI